MNHNRKLTYILLLAGCLGVSLFCLAYPIYVIRPFRHQGVRELAAALVILCYRPAAMALCLAVALPAAALYWRAQPRTWRRILAVFGAAGVCLFTGLSRVNIYEVMFHPMGRPAFVPAGETKTGRRRKGNCRQGGRFCPCSTRFEVSPTTTS